MASTDGNGDIRYKGDIPKTTQIISASLTSNEADEFEHKICTNKYGQKVEGKKNQLSFSFFNFSEVNGLMFLPEA